MAKLTEAMTEQKQDNLTKAHSRSRESKINWLKTAFGIFIVLQFLGGLCSYALAQVEEKYAYVDWRDFPGNRKENSMYSALYPASDGKLYIGLCTHAGASQFYQYDPVTDNMRHIADVPRFLGERGKGIRTAGKVHTKLVEDRQGRIYFGTMCEDSGPTEIDPYSWQGPHWIRYDPKTDKLEDLGLINRLWGIYGLAIDRQRNYLFATAWNGHVYRLDIDRKITRDLGRVDDWDVLRFIVADEEGNVYGCYPPNARIWKYDAKTERIYDLSVSIPRDPAVFPRKMTNPMLERKAIWRVVEWDPVGKVIYGVSGGNSILFRYDPKDGPEGKVTTLGKLCSEYFYHSDRKDVPYSTLAFTIGKDRKIYYAPAGMAFDFTVKVEAATLAADLGGVSRSPHSELITYDLETHKRQYLGILRTTDNRSVFGCGAAACGPDGTIYLCGAVETKDVKNAAGTVLDKYPFKMSLIIYKPNQN